MKKQNTQKGFALMFTILIISIIVAIASGVAITLSKNIILSSTARESQKAFYVADTAGECALFAVRFLDLQALASSSGTFVCGGVTLSIVSQQPNQYTLSDDLFGGNSSFRIEIDQSNAPTTSVKAYGYNTTTGNNILERGIEINF